MPVADNHISVTAESAIREICQPLFAVSAVSYFIFARFYDDGSAIVLPSHARWHQHFWSCGYQKHTPLCLDTGYHFWYAKKAFLRASRDARVFFNVDNRLDVVSRGKNYYELFGFGGKTGDHRVMEDYLNCMGELQKFYFYFKEKAQKLIKRCERPENLLFIEGIKNRSLPRQMKEKPAHSLWEPRRYHFAEWVLSQREWQCLKLLLCGRTAVEISQELNISAKTVESYIEEIKAKLNCETRAHLFDVAYSCGIMVLLNQSFRGFSKANGKVPNPPSGEK